MGIGLYQSCGFVTDFLDTLKVRFYNNNALDFTKQLGTDRLLPGTLNVCPYHFRYLVEAFIFSWQLLMFLWRYFLLIISATIGSFIGSKFVTKIARKRKFNFGWAEHWLFTAVLMALRQTGMLNMLWGEGNTATALTESN